MVFTEQKDRLPAGLNSWASLLLVHVSGPVVANEVAGILKSLLTWCAMTDVAIPHLWNVCKKVRDAFAIVKTEAEIWIGL